jgi:ribose/xylose/arabinose/galactoside ABC-type transport system permease subunit
MPPLARLLVLTGLALVAAGVALWLLPGAASLGRLPADLRFERDGLRVYVPITSSILVSVALTALFWLISRWR